MRPWQRVAATSLALLFCVVVSITAMVFWFRPKKSDDNGLHAPSRSSSSEATDFDDLLDMGSAEELPLAQSPPALAQSPPALAPPPPALAPPGTTRPAAQPAGRAGEIPTPWSQGACIVETMRDFKFAESFVWPKGAAPEIDNIQQVAPRHFKFILRHRGSWYDGDRNLKNNSKGLAKSRAETYATCYNKLGTDLPFNIGDTWLIGSTVRLAPDFVPGRGYCNIMQPVNHQSFLNLTALRGDVVEAKLGVFSNGIGSKITYARTVQIKRGEWTSLVVKAKFAKDGYYGLSINGDPFQGVALDTTRGGDRKPPFGGNFGLYGNAKEGVDRKPLRDQIVEHHTMFYKKCRDASCA